MTRIIIAGAVGAVVYYIWGMLAWMAIPLHTPTIPLKLSVASRLTADQIDAAPFSTAAPRPRQSSTAGRFAAKG